MNDNKKEFKPAVEFDRASMEVEKVIDDKEPIRIKTEETDGEHHHHHHEHTSGEHHHEHTSGEHHHEHTSGEHHHEHSSGEHHHHDGSGSSSGKHHHSKTGTSRLSSGKLRNKDDNDQKLPLKKTAKWCSKNKVKLMIGTLLVMLAVILLLSLTIGYENRRWNKKNAFSLTTEGNKVTFTQCNAECILIIYGHTEANVSRQDALECLDDLSDTFAYTVLYNGDYTCTAIFTDGSRKNLWFTVDCNDEPLVLSAQGGMIGWETNPGFTVKDLFYAFGLHLGKPDADYYSPDHSGSAIASLGNGIHTLRITAEKNGETRVYYQAITVRDCVSPNVLLLGNEVGVFCYGFDVAKVTYAKGEYGTLSEMLQNGPVTASVNSVIPLDDFETGTYTFCFGTPERDYFVTFIRK